VWARMQGQDTPLRAGTLPIGNESRGLFFFDLTRLPADLADQSFSFFVTEESVMDPQIPSQIIVLSDV